MNHKDVAQLLVSGITPFIAAGAALWIASLQRRERLSCFVTYGGQYSDDAMVGLHNRSSQTVAIITVRYLSGSLLRRPCDGTALDYEDPTDLRFPYIVPPGEVIKMKLDEHQAKRRAEAVDGWRLLVLRVLRRSRILVECQSSAGIRYRTSGEPVLNWADRVPWRR